MSFHQYIEYKALDRMYATENDAILGMVLRDSDTGEAVKSQMRNVCALISQELFDSLENMCGLLEISKRKFIEGAVIEAIDQANRIVEEVGLFEHYASLDEHRSKGDAVNLTLTAVEGE